MWVDMLPPHSAMSEVILICSGFTVTRMGSVLTEAVLNGKDTRLFLHLPDKNKMNECTIVLEPLEK